MTDVWSTWRRLTLKGVVELNGIGLHSGEEAVVRMVPSAPGSGTQLVRVDVLDGMFGVLKPELVVPGPLCTLLRNESGVTVSTIEHLMAALAGLGVTDVVIEIEGGEVPILDGSAKPWVEAILAAGVEEAGPLAGGAGKAAEGVGMQSVYMPGPVGELVMRVAVDFDHAAIGAQVWDGVMTPRIFMDEICSARSFILEKDLAAARAAGLVKGASLETGVLFGTDGRVGNPEGLRFADEPVRHKVLDAIGDLALAGGLVPWGKYDLNKPGHAGNNALLRAMVE